MTWAGGAAGDGHTLRTRRPHIPPAVFWAARPTPAVPSSRNSRRCPPDWPADNRRRRVARREAEARPPRPELQSPEGPARPPTRTRSALRTACWETRLFEHKALWELKSVVDSGKLLLTKCSRLPGCRLKRWEQNALNVPQDFRDPGLVSALRRWTLPLARWDLGCLEPRPSLLSLQTDSPNPSSTPSKGDRTIQLQQTTGAISTRTTNRDIQGRQHLHLYTQAGLLSQTPQMALKHSKKPETSKYKSREWAEVTQRGHCYQSAPDHTLQPPPCGLQTNAR